LPETMAGGAGDPLGRGDGAMVGVVFNTIISRADPSEVRMMDLNRGNRWNRGRETHLISGRGYARIPGRNSGKN
jgi:hypothetical protein